MESVLYGNDDCGQVSAWYIFSALGFYPVKPVLGEYIFGMSQVNETTLHLPNGKTFTIKANNLSASNKYVKVIRLNEKRWIIFRLNIKTLKMLESLNMI